jgi:CubicO group peptidase (beta-lactamase class C family)
MKRAILGATLTGALVFVTPICWTQSWAQDQGRPPAPPALVGMGLPEVPPEQVGMSRQKLDRIHDVLKQHVADGKLPGTVVLVARKGKLIYADVSKEPKNDSGGAGAVSTAADYLRFSQMLLNGGQLDGTRILSRTTVALMTSDHLGSRIATPFGPGEKIEHQRRLLRCMSPEMAVRPEGANHQWRKNPPGELSIDPVADERLAQVTARVGAS